MLLVNHMGIQFKKCTLSDIPQLIKVATKSYREHYTYLWEDGGESYIANHFNEASFKQELLQTNSEFYLVLWHEKAVGFFKINYQDKMNLELERIYLVAAAKGNGIGKSSVQFVENLAINRRKSIICLKTMQKGKAYSFYAKCGFKIVGIDVLDVPFIKKEYIEMFVMEKVITQNKL